MHFAHPLTPSTRRLLNFKLGWRFRAMCRGLRVRASARTRIRSRSGIQIHNRAEGLCLWFSLMAFGTIATRSTLQHTNCNYRTWLRLHLGVQLEARPGKLSKINMDPACFPRQMHPHLCRPPHFKSIFSICNQFNFNDRAFAWSWWMGRWADCSRW